MHDQAATLRKQSRLRKITPLGGRSVLTRTSNHPSPCTTQVISITSGKGGVGKTNIVVNLATALAMQGNKVLVLDADFGLANVDVLLGLAPKFHLGHFLYGGKSLRDILVLGPQGIPIVPAAPGIALMSQLEEDETERLITELNIIIEEYDFLLIDTATGISENVTRLLLASPQIVVVCSPDPAAVVDAYAVIKIVSRIDPVRPIHVLVNGVTSGLQGTQIFDQISRVSKKFLSRELLYLGHVSQDERVTQAVREQRPVVMEFPASSASDCFRHLARELTPRLAPPDRTALRLVSSDPRSRISPEVRH